MDSPKRKIGKYTSLIVILLLSVTCVYLCINNIAIIKSINNKNKQIKQLEEKISSQQDTISAINDEIIYYESLNDNLIQIKQTFFDNALKADQLARSGEADFKVCYLTFDDGPYLLTDTILDILEEKDVLATFFARKRLDEDYIPIYLRERVNGHTIGNHTASHKISKGIYRSNEIFINDIIENRQFIFDMLGVTTDVMRFPGGSYEATYMGLSKSKLVNELNDIGYGYVDWTHATGDGGATLSPYEYLHNVIDYTDDDRAIVVLMHDYSKNTAECLPEMIDELSKQGYIFLPLWHDSPAVKKGA